MMIVAVGGERDEDCEGLSRKSRFVCVTYGSLGRLLCPCFLQIHRAMR